MDNRSFIKQLAQNVEVDTATATATADALTSTLSMCLANLDTVAIPGFGTFRPEKTDEYVATGSDGSRTLMPPAINVTFIAGSRLNKDTAPKK